MRKSRLIITLLGALALLLSGIAIGPSAAGAEANVTDWLESVGADPAKTVFQEGLLNYAGPSCPGSEWSCTDTDQPVVQTAFGFGTNLFECPLGEAGCVVLQRGGSEGSDLLSAGPFGGVASAGPGNSSPNNIAHCNENPSNPSPNQVCNITQIGTSAPGKNKATATMVLIQKDNSAAAVIKGTQTLFITQECDGCSNDANVKMKVKQDAAASASTAISQIIEASQSATIKQTAPGTGGSNAAIVEESQSQSETATGGPSILQCENANAPECPSSQPGVDNIFLDLFQGGTQTSSGDVTQALVQTADGSTPGSNVVTQRQGGAVEILHDQPNGGTLNYKQSESQTVNAHSTADQDQEGQVKCCLPIKLSPDFITGTQSKVQSATGDPDPEQEITEIFIAKCDVNCSNDQTATNNEGTTTNSVSGSGVQAATIHCDPECTTTSTDGGDDVQSFFIYDETQDGIDPGDRIIGHVEADANPNGEERLIINANMFGAAPSCTLTVELVRDDFASNGGLDEIGHTGSIQVIGTLTTTASGSGDFFIDFNPNPSGDGVPNTQVFGHIDFEDYNSGSDGGCTEFDESSVQPNEYGAAPDPALNDPFTWMESGPDPGPS